MSDMSLLPQTTGLTLQLPSVTMEDLPGQGSRSCYSLSRMSRMECSWMDVFWRLLRELCTCLPCTLKVQIISPLWTLNMTLCTSRLRMAGSLGVILSLSRA
ncbi:ORF2 [Turkey adenovirus 3]|uniref:Uncharacterized protein n=1 Tax=Turkey adenovirus 3 TaxID=41678 RepID=Q9YUS0_9ADEN|nr:hypothetical protein TaV3gp02 [Turkey adenovirus 3]AAC64540.1 ORF2 [Turkey adenovirus 3]